MSACDRSKRETRGAQRLVNDSIFKEQDWRQIRFWDSHDLAKQLSYGYGPRGWSCSLRACLMEARAASRMAHREARHTPSSISTGEKQFTTDAIGYDGTISSSVISMKTW